MKDFRGYLQKADVNESEFNELIGLCKQKLGGEYDEVENTYKSLCDIDYGFFWIDTFDKDWSYGVDNNNQNLDYVSFRKMITYLSE